MNRSRITLALMAAFCLAGGALPRALAADEPAPVYKDPKAGLEARVQDLLGRLTFEEKLSLLGGTGFGTTPIARLGVPPMGMCDGPIGVRGGGEGTTGPATVFPCGIAMASTWDPALVQREGVAIGRELQNKGPGSQVILGPCVCIHRTPLGGRNGESYSEDPYLAGRMAAAYVTGVQSTGAASCIKHYACNNQEWDRGSINVRVSERALREIYLPAFRAAVQEAGLWCVMNAYNKVNGPHCSANDYLLNEVLKRDWGFSGCCMTDWGAAHSTLGCALGGTDLEMPGGWFMNPRRLSPLIQQGKISREVIDEKVRRILRTIIRVGLLDERRPPDNSIVNCKAHRDLAREAGAKATVLLKNDGNLLPLDIKALHSIALLGPNAAENRTSMGGSGYVAPAQNISALQAVRQRAPEGLTINYAKGADMGDEALPPIPAESLTPPAAAPGEHGLKGEYFANQDLQGAPAVVRTDAKVSFMWSGGSPDPKIPHDHFSARWTGKLAPPVTGDYQLGTTSDDGSRIFLDGKLVVDSWRDHAMESATARLHLEAGKQYDLRVEFYQNTGDAGMILGWRAPGGSEATDPQIAEAVEAAKKSEVAVIFAGLSAQYESEGLDRVNLELPGRQNALIKAVVAANPKTVVVLTNGTPLMIGQWVKQAPAILEAWYLGSEGGYAITDVLFGDVNPSGKLADTLAQRREDYPDFGNYPGANGEVDYAEGIYVGYRSFDKKSIEPLYPFGYGLSYTTFEYSDLALTPQSIPADGKATVTLTVRNTGPRAGEEVVELYLDDPAPQVDKPVRELKRFAKVALQPGEAKPVTFTLDAEALAYCDAPNKQWRADAGRYEVQIGASSRDIRLHGDLNLTTTWTQPVPGMGKWQAEAEAGQGGKNLALHRPVQASSVEKEDTQPQFAVDGDMGTRWSSQFSDPQWISVDLGQVMKVNCVKLAWEAAFGSAYCIEVSTDGQQWRQVYSTTEGQGEEETINFPVTEARYVRLTGHKRGTEFGYSLWEFGVYGP